MTRRVPVWPTLAVLVLVLCACGGSSSSGPPNIRYGRSVCDHCHMIISDPRTAAAYRTESGDARVFDDIGDLLDFGLLEDELASARVWVHDYGTEEWVDADAAWFVVDAGLETPMGSGIVAFATSAAADELTSVRSGGRVLRWAELVRIAVSEEPPAAEPQGTDGSPLTTGIPAGTTAR